MILPYTHKNINNTPTATTQAPNGPFQPRPTRNGFLFNRLDAIAIVAVVG